VHSVDVGTLDASGFRTLDACNYGSGILHQLVGAERYFADCQVNNTSAVDTVFNFTGFGFGYGFGDILSYGAALRVSVP
jgi:hypothetical protein